METVSGLCSIAIGLFLELSVN